MYEMLKAMNVYTSQDAIEAMEEGITKCYETFTIEHHRTKPLPPLSDPRSMYRQR
ncbi:hypothetical protein HON71_00145 [Candidatus Woesearchaeota archaeon]|jgi:hypothetical protein|nr:hypothetical protein [Candidatus Woesearchaeota archaeon]MBT5342618.1 hypothetical protein [Candidatus Woesearchaeota archaeon]